jgi:hypothetical protein
LEHWLSTIHCTTICVSVFDNNLYAQEQYLRTISSLVQKDGVPIYLFNMEIQWTPKTMFTGDGGQNHNIVWFLLLITTKFCVHAFNLIRYTWYLLFALRSHSILFNDNIFVSVFVQKSYTVISNFFPNTSGPKFFSYTVSHAIISNKTQYDVWTKSPLFKRNTWNIFTWNIIHTNAWSIRKMC